MKKSILIIGSSGFFGNSIIEYIRKKKSLKKRFNKIILITRSKKNFIPLSLKKSYEILQIKMDISKAKKIPFSDYVIYCAISKNYTQDNLAVKNYYQLAKKYHVGSSIVYTSSGAVYGKQSKNILKINDFQKTNLKKYTSALKQKYALLKIKNEQIFKKLTNHKIKVSVARCFTFVGKHLPLESNFVIGNFIKNILDKEDIIVKSKMKVFRSYMHADDLAECLLKLVLKNSFNYETYNIGSENVVNIHTVAQLLGKKYNLKHVKSKKKIANKYDRYIPNINKFRKKFKFKNKLDSYKAIIKTINELKNK